jgi:hypothetical protein
LEGGGGNRGEKQTKYNTPITAPLNVAYSFLKEMRLRESLPPKKNWNDY